MNAERLKVLKMLEEGKINASTANQLLEALQTGDPAPSPDKQETNAAARLMVIQVTDAETGKRKVNLRVPLSMIRAAEKFGGNLNLGGVKIDNLAELLNEGKPGPIIDVLDEAKKEHVEVYLD